MSRYPSATWKPISGTSRTRVQKDILCLHTMVGYLGSTWTYFNRPDVGVYSHIGIGGIWGSDAAAGLDGVAWQMADTDYRAAANLDGNWRIISVETADNAARPIQPWTPKQCDRIVAILADANRIDGIPLVLIPDSKPGRRGIAYHRLGCNPYRVSGGELWSSAYGKDCPTQARIDQLPGLIDRARAIVAGQQEDDMEADEVRQILGLKPGQNMALAVYGQGDNSQVLRRITASNDDNSVAARLGRIETAVGDLAAAVKALTAPPDPSKPAASAAAGSGQTGSE